jgi:hypothetical protein
MRRALLTLNARLDLNVRTYISALELGLASLVGLENEFARCLVAKDPGFLCHYTFHTVRGAKFSKFSL